MEPAWPAPPPIIGMGVAGFGRRDRLKLLKVSCACFSEKRNESCTEAPQLNHLLNGKHFNGSLNHRSKVSLPGSPASCNGNQVELPGSDKLLNGSSNSDPSQEFPKTEIDPLEIAAKAWAAAAMAGLEVEESPQAYLQKTSAPQMAPYCLPFVPNPYGTAKLISKRMREEKKQQKKSMKRKRARQTGEEKKATEVQSMTELQTAARDWAATQMTRLSEYGKTAVKIPEQNFPDVANGEARQKPAVSPETMIQDSKPVETQEKRRMGGLSGIIQGEEDEKWESLRSSGEAGIGVERRNQDCENKESKRVPLTAEQKAKRKAKSRKKRAAKRRLEDESGAGNAFLRPKRDINPQSLPPCKFWLEGRCSKGTDCQFSHHGIPHTKSEICKFHLQGCCMKGEDDCAYSHDLKKFPCKFHHLGGPGACMDGPSCRFSHELASPEAIQQLIKRVEEGSSKSSSKGGSEATHGMPSGGGQGHWQPSELAYHTPPTGGFQVPHGEGVAGVAYHVLPPGGNGRTWQPDWSVDGEVREGVWSNPSTPPGFGSGSFSPGKEAAVCRTEANDTATGGRGQMDRLACGQGQVHDYPAEFRARLTNVGADSCQNVPDGSIGQVNEVWPTLAEEVGSYVWNGNQMAFSVRSGKDKSFRDREMDKLQECNGENVRNGGAQGRSGEAVDSTASAWSPSVSSLGLKAPKSELSLLLQSSTLTPSRSLSRKAVERDGKGSGSLSVADILSRALGD